MRHDVDGGVGDEIDVVTAEGQRAFEIAGIEYIEKIQYALPVELCDQCSFSAGVAPDRHFQVHCGLNFAVINRQKIPTIGLAHIENGSQPKAVFHMAKGRGPAAAIPSRPDCPAGAAALPDAASS